jgi:hypothetical protein
MNDERLGLAIVKRSSFIVSRSSMEFTGNRQPVVNDELLPSV